MIYLFISITMFELFLFILHASYYFKNRIGTKQYLDSSKKATNRTTYDPTLPFLGIYLKKMDTLIWKDICALMSIEALFIIAKMWNKF